MIGCLIAAVSFSLILPIVEDKGIGFSFVLIGAPVVRAMVLAQGRPKPKPDRRLDKRSVGIDRLVRSRQI